MRSSASVAPEVLPGLGDVLSRQIIEQSQIGTLLIENHIITYANPRCEETFSRPVEELIGMSLADVLPFQCHRTDSCHSPRLGCDLSVFSPIHGVPVKESCRDVEIQTTALHTPDGRKVTVISILDVTDRNRRVERARDTLVEEWRGTFNALSTPIVITRKDGTVARVNRAACELCGLSE